MTFSRPFYPTPTLNGRSSRSSSIYWYRNSPHREEEDLSIGILEAIDMDSYRVEKKAAMKVALADEEAEIEPVPTEGGAGRASPSWTVSVTFSRAFNEQFSTLFTDTDRVAKRFARISRPKSPPTRPTRMRRLTRRIRRGWLMTRRLNTVMQALLKDDIQVYKAFVENKSFKRFIGDMVYAITNQ